MKALTAVMVLLGVVGGAWLLAGCKSGQGGAPGSESTQVFNDADVTFAQQMIVHHHQAVVMADLATERAQSPEVMQLATQIAAEQAPEIETMSGWLRAWGKPVPSASHEMASPMPTSGGMSYMMPSMTPEPGMSQMMQMHGAQFEQMFLQMMIAHHEAAVAMAKAEEQFGVNPQAKELAKHIEVSQSAQITQMRQMLQSPSAHHS